MAQQKKREDKKAAPRVAKVAKAGRRSATGGKHAGEGKTEKTEIAQAVTLGKSDLLEGNVRAGHLLQLGETVYEMKERNMLVLLSSKEVSLLNHVSVHQDIFVTIGQVLGEFSSPLANGRRTKQEAMHTHIREVLGEEGLERLQKMREARRPSFQEQPVQAIVKAVPQERNTFDDRFVGPMMEFWERAASSVEVFKELTVDNMVEIRFGKNAEEGIVFGFYVYHEEGWPPVIRMEAGHIGAKHHLTNIIVKRSFLDWRKGFLPAGMSDEACEKSMKVASAREMLYFVQDGLPPAIRNPFIDAVRQAYKRLYGQNGQNRPATDHIERNEDVREDRHNGHAQRHGSMLRAPQFNRGGGERHHNAGNDLPGFMNGLREEGIDGKHLASLIAAYQGTGSHAQG